MSLRHTASLLGLAFAMQAATASDPSPGRIDGMNYRYENAPDQVASQEFGNFHGWGVTFEFETTISPESRGTMGTLLTFAFRLEGGQERRIVWSAVGDPGTGGEIVAEVDGRTAALGSYSDGVSERVSVTIRQDRWQIERNGVPVLDESVTAAADDESFFLQVSLGDVDASPIDGTGSVEVAIPELRAEGSLELKGFLPARDSWPGISLIGGDFLVEVAGDFSVENGGIGGGEIGAQESSRLGDIHIQSGGHFSLNSTGVPRADFPWHQGYPGGNISIDSSNGAGAFPSGGVIPVGGISFWEQTRTVQVVTQIPKPRPVVQLGKTRRQAQRPARTPAAIRKARSLLLKTGSQGSGRFFAGIRNPGANSRFGVEMSQVGRIIDTTVFTYRKPGRKNVTAQMRAGRYQTAAIGFRKVELFQIAVGRPAPAMLERKSRTRLILRAKTGRAKGARTATGTVRIR